MNKYEFELEKLIIRSRNVRHYLELIKQIATLGAILVCVYLIFDGLKGIAASSPSSLNALSLLVEKLGVSNYIAYIVAVTTSAAWVYERGGKKRLLKKVGDKRKAVEADDLYNGSSGLTDTGETP